MYQLTINGKAVGKKHRLKGDVIAQVIRLWPTMHGLGWTRV